jgi:hypothetical protein
VSVVPPPPSVGVPLSPMIGSVLVGNSQTLTATVTNTSVRHLGLELCFAGSAQFDGAYEINRLPVGHNYQLHAEPARQCGLSLRLSALTPYAPNPATTLWLASLRKDCVAPGSEHHLRDARSRRFVGPLPQQSIFVLGLLVIEKHTAKSNRPRGVPRPVEVQ